MTGLILSVIASLVVSALCSFMEAALYSLPWSHIERMKKSGGRAGEMIYNLRNNIEKPITAILTLNTIANTAGAAVAGSFAAQALGEGNLPLFAGAFTLAILIFSEIIPKTLGVIYSRRSATFLAYGAHFMVTLLAPFILLSGFLIKLITPKHAAPPATEEDVNALMGLLRRTGRIEQYEETAVRNILELDTKAVRDIMTPRTVAFTLPVDITVAEARERNGMLHFSRIPVYGDNNEDVIGQVSRRRILEELGAGRADTPLSKLMRPIHFVPETLPLDRLLLRFLDERVHLQAVLDEFGGLAGIVSLEDVLEEILGREIVDETDEVADMRELARKRRQGLLHEKNAAEEKG